MSAHVITVAQQKGGTGKSTLAVHLAVAFAKQGYSTMLFDTDPQGTVSHWHAQRKDNDIGLIATSGWRLTRDLAMAKEANDIIIIDTPPHAEMDIKVSTRAADMVVVPLQPSPADMWAVRETMNTVASESAHAMVVLNRVVARANITKDTTDKLALMDIPVAKTHLGSRVLYAAAMESGMTVLDGFANPASKEISGLINEIASVLGVSIKGKSSSKSTTTQAVKKTSTSTTKSASKKTATTKSSSSKKTASQTVAKKSASSTTTKSAAKKTTTKKPAAKTATKRQTLSIATKKTGTSN